MATTAQPAEASVTADPHHRRSDIQGLRAIAVAFVVLYHARIPVLTGGFVGVDVFYVISGFLIIGLIVDEIDAHGTVSLAGFWNRRIRRLLPASMLVLVVTLIVSRLFLPPLTMVSVSQDAEWTALYVPNFHFAVKGTDYLSSDLPSPFLHYWSLAVEEQFYLFFPLLAFAATKWTRRPRRTLIVVLAAGSVLSLLACVYVTNLRQPVAFFLLPFRAWELAAGGLLALGMRSLRRKPPTLFVVIGWAGMVLVAASGILYSDSTVYPSYRALLPVLGAAMLLASGAAGSGVLQQILSWRPITWVGDISYSLYLWHWPLLVIPAQAVRYDLNGYTRALLVVASVALAGASYHFVEDPLRRSRFLASRRTATYLVAGIATVLVVAGSAFAGQIAPLNDGRQVAPVAGGPLPANYQPSRVPSNVDPTLEHASHNLSPASADGCLIGFPATKPKPCTYGDISASRSIVIFGDSHAEVWVSPLERIAQYSHLLLTTYLKSSCPPALVDAYQARLNRPFHECDTWRGQAIAQIIADRPVAVIIAGFREQPLVGSNTTAIRAAGMRATVRELTAAGLSVYWLGDGPEFPEDIPTCLSVNLDSAADCDQPRNKVLNTSGVSAEKDAVQAAGGTFIDTNDWVCPGDVCPVMYGQYVMYRDAHHLSADYATTLAPALRQQLVDALAP